MLQQQHKATRSRSSHWAENRNVSLTMQSSIKALERLPSVPPLLAPVGLLGGSAALYAHILNASNGNVSSLTPLAALYMILLAVQYAIQPKLSRACIGPHTSKVQTALTEEVTKSVLAAALLVASHSAAQIKVLLSQWSWRRSLVVAGTPAVLYAIQGVLQYQSHQHLDAVSFNGLQQTKILSAALCCWLLLGQSQSIPQLAGLGVLFLSALQFQKGTTDDSTPVRFWRGVVPCVAATLISGLAGALSQKGLQLQSRLSSSMVVTTDPFLYSLEVSAYSALVLAVQQSLRAIAGPKKPSHPGNITSKQPTDEWSWKILLPVSCKAVGGILTALVHKHTGAVSKGFALVFGLVLAAVMESTLSHSHMSIHQVWGTVLVIAAGWLHFAH